MIQVPIKTKKAVDCSTLLTINSGKVQAAKNRQTIDSLNISENAAYLTRLSATSILTYS